MALLQLEEIDVRFGGIRALDEVTLDVEAAAITGLIGPNGAGKTTLFNVACGLTRPQRGRVLLDGTDVGGVPPHRRARLGLGRTFQRLEVFGSLTVLENVLVAAEIRRFGTRDGSVPRAVADESLERTGLRAIANERVDALPTGLARIVELARTLATKPRVILLDEPSSGLDDRETDGLATLLLALAADGLGLLLVEHDVDLVMRVCGRIHVLDFGRRIASGSPSEIQADEAVRAAYLGDPGEDVA